MGLKHISILLMATFYVVAGVNHFIDPEFYYDLIPDYLPFPDVINTLSGLAEIVLGLGILFKKSRRVSGYLIVIMLIGFIPAHVYFLQIGSCVEGGLCVPEWISWLRLLVIHPLLIWWAFSVSRFDTTVFRSSE